MDTHYSHYFILYEMPSRMVGDGRDIVTPLNISKLMSSGYVVDYVIIDDVISGGRVQKIIIIMH